MRGFHPEKGPMSFRFVYGPVIPLGDMFFRVLEKCFFKNFKKKFKKSIDKPMKIVLDWDLSFIAKGAAERRC